MAGSQDPAVFVFGIACESVSEHPVVERVLRAQLARTRRQEWLHDKSAYLSFVRRIPRQAGNTSKHHASQEWKRTDTLARTSTTVCMPAPWRRPINSRMDNPS
jgi:hypothetical protein